MTQRPDDPRRAGRRPPFDPMAAIPESERGYREATLVERAAAIRAGRTGLVGIYDGVPCYRAGSPRGRRSADTAAPTVMRYAAGGRFVVPNTRG